MMIRRHIKMFQRMLAMMKVESDYHQIDEIRILNDGGGTGTWHIAIQVHGRTIKAANFPTGSIFAEPERLKADEYYEVSYDKKEFC